MFHYIKRLLTFLISLIKKICRKNHKDTPLLPSALKSNSKFDKDEKWDDWEPMTGVQIDKKNEETEEEPPQVDFFADMVPEFKQPAQIRIRSTSNDVAPQTSSSSRLTVDTSFDVGLLAGGVGLGELADSEPGGWGEDETLDDSEIIAVKNEATKKKRASEREKRRKEKERSSKLS